MNSQELTREIKTKSFEFEKALEAGAPHAELLQIYKEIKRLQFQLLETERLNEAVWRPK
jgi:hypothetical protein